MRILITSPTSLKMEVGSTRALKDLHQELELQGWEVEIVGPEEIGLEPGSGADFSERYSETLRSYLKERAHRFDVAEYDHAYLPFARSEFPPRTLMVCRIQLLAHYLETVRLPVQGLEKAVKGFLAAPIVRMRNRAVIQRAHRTISESDLVVAQNPDDAEFLARRGISRGRLAVLPIGLNRKQAVLLSKVELSPPAAPRIGFVGSFDDRKGAADFPKISEAVWDRLPETQFRLVGTAGVYPDPDGVLSFFPKNRWKDIEVVPRFPQEELSKLLSDCSVGVFPSYMESFGLGVLEMLAAGIPVFAYRCPGPSQLLPVEHLLEPGDAGGMGTRAAELLKDPVLLAKARNRARELAEPFRWEKQVLPLMKTYRERWEALQEAR